MTQDMNRQEFLNSLVRRGAMLGMGGVALAAVHGSRSPEECFETTTLCNECWANHSCSLPEKGLDPDERAKKNRPA
ncbi:MAG: hypothetical protein KF886_14965 [Candidatus Hydrogenedentes bacterium]|nr:hypothetical protein [Candidatus Hydrogenedentota bacterium]